MRVRHIIFTGASTSSAESFAANNHPVPQADMTDPMADFLGGHQNMTENDKIIKVSPTKPTVKNLYCSISYDLYIIHILYYSVTINDIFCTHRLHSLSSVHTLTPRARFYIIYFYSSSAIVVIRPSIPSSSPCPHAFPFGIRRQG